MIFNKYSSDHKYENISVTVEDLVYYLSNPLIKFYIMNEKNDDELKEKCNEFFESNLKNCLDKKGFLKVFKDLLIKDKSFRNIIIESKKFSNDMKISVFVNLVQIVFLIIFVVSFCILLHSFKIQFGLLRILTTFISILFIVSVIFICFKIFFQLEKKTLNKEIDSNN